MRSCQRGARPAPGQSLGRGQAPGLPPRTPTKRLCLLDLRQGHRPWNHSFCQGNKRGRHGPRNVTVGPSCSPDNGQISCVDGPSDTRGSGAKNPTNARFECGHVSGLLTRASDRWPRWDPRTSPKQGRGVEAPLQSTGCLVRRFDRLSSRCSQASFLRGTGERVRPTRARRACLGKLPRSSSWPTPRGPSCWPEPPPRLCAAGVPARTTARPRHCGRPA